MSILLNSFLILLLFILLGFSADLTVKNIKYIGSHLKIKLFVFGILLGIITTLPELTLGINAVIDDVAGLSVGNIFGGILVMLGLILGFTLLFIKEIKTDGKIKTLIPSMLLLLFPFFLGMDGKFGNIDGLILIISYLVLVYFLYKSSAENQNNFFSFEIINIKKISLAILLTLAGIIGVLVSSNWIVKITLNILENIAVNPLIIGLLVFSIGTNLPEISIAITSWRKKSAEFSLSHLLGSSLSNILILGILSFTKPMTFNVDINYFITIIFYTILLFFFSYFYLSEKKIDRKEGIALITIYLFFILASVYLVK